MHFVLNRRLQKAKFLLTNEKDFSIAEITFQTGFTSPNYFSKVFKFNVNYGFNSLIINKY
ncbi:helix-turn-helix domain-containing protein [Pedobacter sp.]